MAAGAVAEPAPSWPHLKSQLEKRTTFEAAARGAAAAARAAPAPAALACDAEFRSVLARCFALLRSRYTSPAFWAAGRELFRAAAASAQHDAVLSQQLEGYLAACEEHLGAEEASSVQPAAGAPEVAAAARGGVAPAAAAGASRQQQGFLFEGQLSAGGEAPPPRGPLGQLEGLLSAAGLLVQQAQQQGGQQGEQPPAVDEALQEALQQELDAIAIEIMEATGAEAPRTAPPASQRAVRALQRETLDAARLAELGGEAARCPVCMEELAVGAEVQVMPCQGKHAFHPACLAPWLQQRNSCPTCRHELPTDDPEYDRRREREAEEAEAARGAANATADKFMYL